MPGIPSLLPPARRARPRCEPLEGRTLLAAAVAPSSAEVPVTFDQVSQALRAAWDRLEAMPPEAPARSLSMDFDQDEQMDQLALVRPEGTSSEILDFLATEAGAAENGDFTTRHRQTLGYVAGSLMIQDLDRDGVVDVFLASAPEEPHSVHATLMLTALYPSPEHERRVEDTTLTVAAQADWPPLVTFPIVARDVTGDDLVDLVVTCPLSDSTWVLRGLGNGRFDDLPWLVRPVGARPIASFVEDFNGDGQLDLVTVDSASDDVTFYSNLASPSSSRTTFSAGGQHPVAALVRDVNGDHVPDLIVANQNDGRVSLFLGGPDGLALRETILTPAARPTALAGGGEDARRVYVAMDNDEPGQWLSFTLTAPPMAGPEILNQDDPVSPTLDLEPARTEGKLRSLSPAGLDLVPTLVSPLGESEDLPGSAPSDAPGADELTAAGRAIRGQLALLVLGASLDDQTNFAEEEGEASEATMRSEEQLGLQRFLLGVEEAGAPTIAPEGGSGPSTVGLFPLPAASEVDSRDLPPGEKMVFVEGDEEGRDAAPGEPTSHEDDEPAEGDLLAGARQALVVAIVSQVGLAWGVLWRRRRKGSE